MRRGILLSLLLVACRPEAKDVAPDAASVAVQDAAVVDAAPPSSIPLPGPMEPGGKRCAADAGTAKARFVALSRRPALGPDKIGADGGLDPDGFGDQIIDITFEGGALAFLLVNEMESIEAGTPFGDMRVRGTDKLHVQKHVATLVVFDGDRALNDRTRPLELGEGTHHLALRVSGYHVKAQTQWRVWAVRADCTLLEGPAIR